MAKTLQPPTIVDASDADVASAEDAAADAAKYLKRTPSKTLNGRPTAAPRSPATPGCNLPATETAASTSRVARARPTAEDKLRMLEQQRQGNDREHAALQPKRPPGHPVADARAADEGSSAAAANAASTLVFVLKRDSIDIGFGFTIAYNTELKYVWVSKVGLMQPYLQTLISTCVGS